MSRVRNAARGVRKGLTPERILAAAVKIVDRDGPDALTMRRLGAELGVAAMAIYNHFADRDALLDALAEQALSNLPIRRTRGAWRKRVKAIIQALHKLATEHPQIYALIMSRPTKPTASLALLSESMDALRQAGLTEKDTVRWYHTFLILIHGYASWRASYERHCASPSSHSDFASLEPQQLQDWRAVHSVSADKQFDQAVDLLLDRLA